MLVSGEVPELSWDHPGGEETASYTYYGQQVAGWGWGGERLSGRYWPVH